MFKVPYLFFMALVYQKGPINSFCVSTLSIVEDFSFFLIFGRKLWIDKGDIVLAEIH